MKKKYVIVGEGDSDNDGDNTEGLQKDIADLLDQIKTDHKERKDADAAKAAADAEAAAKEAAAKKAPPEKGIDVEELTKMIKDGKGGEAIKDTLEKYHRQVIEPERAAIFNRDATVQRDTVAKTSKAAAKKGEKSEFERYETEIDEYIKINNVSADQLAQPGNYERILKWVQAQDPGFIDRKVEESLKKQRRDIEPVEGGGDRDLDRFESGDDDAEVNFTADQLHMFSEMGLNTEEDIKRVKEAAKKVRRVERDPKLRKQAIKDGGIPI